MTTQAFKTPARCERKQSRATNEKPMINVENTLSTYGNPKVEWVKGTDEENPKLRAQHKSPIMRPPEGLLVTTQMLIRGIKGNHWRERLARMRADRARDKEDKAGMRAQLVSGSNWQMLSHGQPGNRCMCQNLNYELTGPAIKLPVSV